MPHTMTPAAHPLHPPQIKYDDSRAVGKKFYMTWCSLVVTKDTETCPDSVASLPGKCGQTKGGHACCFDKCPDGHPGVSLLL